MIPESERQDIINQEHLRLLSILHWVSGGLMAFVSLLSLFYIGMGLLLAQSWSIRLPSDGGHGPPPAAFGWFFVVFGLVFFAFFATLAILMILAGAWIRNRRKRVLCMIVAGISCALFPYGTLLGVSTLIVLVRPSVVRLFELPPPVTVAPPVSVPPRVD